jgi:D-aspartate ligase
MTNPPAVILGGAVTALSVARSLSDAGVPVWALDSRDSPLRASRLRRGFVEVAREDMQPRMLQWLRSGPRGAVVLAASDEGLELIARHRSELLALDYVPMEADDEALLAMLDKERSYALAERHGIPAPRVRRLSGREEVDAIARELSYPCVLKPVHSHVFARRAKLGAKVLTVTGPEELRSVCERMSAIGVEMLVTEVISGPDDEYVSYYGYLDEHGEPLLQFTKRKIRQDPPHFGLGTYHATTHDPEVAELGLRFLRGAGLRGLGNVEFKRDGSDGRLKVIECNARFTMANELIRAAGVDLALFSYNRLLGRPAPAVEPYREDVRLWYPLEDVRAFLRYRRDGELSLRRWAGSLLYRQHLPVARLDDPLPALVRNSRKLWHSARAAAGTSPRRSRRAPRARARNASARRRRRLNRPQRAERVPDALYERIWREAAEATGANIERLAPGVFELSRGAAATRVIRHMVDLDDTVTLELARDGELSRRLLAAAGLPVADRLRSGGGRPAAGEVYRLLLLDGELIDATRIAPGLAGMPPGGEVSPRLLAEARSAQSAVGLRLAGVDVATTDLGRPLAESRGAICGVCGAPELHRHYPAAAAQGATPVAIPILRKLLAGPG